MRIMSRLRKPSVLVLLLIALAITLYAVIARWDVGARRVVVTAAQQAELALGFRDQWQRAPTAAELDTLVRDHVLAELGVGTDAAEYVRAPTRDELQAYWSAHKDRYRAPDVLSFRQYFFAPDGAAGGAADEHRRRALQLLERLTAGDAIAALPETANAGLLPPVSSNVSLAAIAERFGAEFAEALGALAPGVWSGPIPSQHGLHIVRVDTRVAAPEPELEALRAQVVEDWQRARRLAAADALYQQLTVTIDVEIEPLPRPTDVLLLDETATP